MVLWFGKIYLNDTRIIQVLESIEEIFISKYQKFCNLKINKKYDLVEFTMSKSKIILIYECEMVKMKSKKAK